MILSLRENGLTSLFKEVRVLQLKRVKTESAAMHPPICVAFSVHGPWGKESDDHVLILAAMQLLPAFRGSRALTHRREVSCRVFSHTELCFKVLLPWANHSCTRLSGHGKVQE